MQSQADAPVFTGTHPNLQTIPAKTLTPYVESYIKAYNHGAPQLFTDKPHQMYKDLLIQPKIENSINKRYNKYHQLEYQGQFPKLFIQVNKYDDQIPKTIDEFNTQNFKNYRCTCKQLKYEFAKILDEATPDDNVIVYNSCKRTVLAAAKRQMKSAPTPDARTIKEFTLWAHNFIDRHLGTYLNNFSYDENQWYNHLTNAKQKEIDVAKEFVHGTSATMPHYTKWNKMPETIKPKLDSNQRFLTYMYEAICKVELQEADGKPRLVCSCPILFKYVLGPVAWALEELFAKHFPGYCGAKSNVQMANTINQHLQDGYHVVTQGDGSAFDNTQDIQLKQAVDHYIYEKILSRIHHVDKDLFYNVTHQFYKTMRVYYMDDKQKVPAMTYTILGTVFSGDPDTTLMNTARMALYNIFINEHVFNKGDIMTTDRFAKEYIVFSKGDDFSCMYRTHRIEQLVREAYARYFLAKMKPKDPTGDLDQRIYGLGQILKFIEFGDARIFEFCSLKAFYIDNTEEKIILTRDPKKFLNLSNYSRKCANYNPSQIVAYLLQQAEALRVSYKGIKIFEQQALRYENKAKQIAKNYPIKQTTLETRDRRRTLSLQTPDDILGIGPRENFIKVNQDLGWWGTVKQHMNECTYNLTPQQLDFVNNEIYHSIYYDILVRDEVRGYQTTNYEFNN